MYKVVILVLLVFIIYYFGFYTRNPVPNPPPNPNPDDPSIGPAPAPSLEYTIYGLGVGDNTIYAVTDTTKVWNAIGHSNGFYNLIYLNQYLYGFDVNFNIIYMQPGSSTYSTIANTGLSENDFMMNFSFDKNGILWGISKYGSLYTKGLSFDLPWSLSEANFNDINDSINSFCFDNEGTIYAISHGKIYKQQNNSFNILPTSNISMLNIHYDYYTETFYGINTSWKLCYSSDLITWKLSNVSQLSLYDATYSWK